MATNKQVMDLHPNSKGINGAESNEQQRNWDDRMWMKKAADPLSNYDPTRRHLNFEVAKGGVVQSIDTSKSISQKMGESLASRGIEDPNSRANVRRRRRTIAQFIFGGSREQMLKLAFGDQDFNPEKGADNTRLQRSGDIENWARDVYNFVAEKFGEDNIVGFYCHLDEVNPHIHCSVIPLNEERNCISWTSRFGMLDGADIIARLHDELEEKVNRKYGLERGDSVEVTKARHRSTEEYKRELVKTVLELEDTAVGLRKQIQTLERKMKSFSTMLLHLEEKKECMQQEIERLKEKFGAGELDNSEFAAKISSLSKKLDNIDEKIEIRQQQLQETNELLDKAHEKLADLQSKNDSLRSENDDLHGRNQSLLRRNESLSKVILDKNDIVATKAERNAAMAFNQSLASSLEPLKGSLSPAQWDILESSGAGDLLRNPNEIMTCAMFLALNYVREATKYAETCGGSGSPGSGWGRDKDEDDEHWWRRCIAQAGRMMHSAGRKVGRRR